MFAHVRVLLGIGCLRDSMLESDFDDFGMKKDPQGTAELNSTMEVNVPNASRFLKRPMFSLFGQRCLG